MKLVWFGGINPDGRPEWSASSPYGDGDSSFVFRIVKLSNGKYKLEHDSELMLPEYVDLRFDSLEDAQKKCQEDCDEIIETEFAEKLPDFDKFPDSNLPKFEK